MIKRERYMRKILDFLDRPVVKVITGMRRSGKSVMLKMLEDEILARGVGSKNVILINLESLRYEHLKEYHALYDEILSRAKEARGKVYILLDEIQEVRGWEYAINSLRVDIDCDISLTGSNAKLLSGELATLLAGRYVEIRLLPLGFFEYLDFAASNADESGLSARENFENYLRFGGLPGIHQMTWEKERIFQYLGDIYNSIMLKDVVARNNIRDTNLLERVIRFVMDNIGNTFSGKTISDFLKSQGRRLSTETVYNYLGAMEAASLIHKVSRYDIKGRKLLETQEKYYLSDIGLKSAVMGYRADEISGILENIVYLELIRREYTVHIGKQQEAEVDFVADRGGERLYVQVCYRLTEENMWRELRPLSRIRDHHEKILLSMDDFFDTNEDGIRQKNLIDFLLT